MNIFKDSVCSVLGAKTYFELELKGEGKALEMRADDVRVTSKEPLDEPVSSKLPVAIVQYQQNRYTGHLLNSPHGSSNVSLITDAGSRVETIYDTLITDLHPTFTFKPKQDQIVSVRLTYDHGFVCGVISDVVDLNEKTIIIRQHLQLTNNLPFDVCNLKDVQVLFQESHPHACDSWGDGSAEVKSPIDDVTNEIGAPINLGAIKVIPKFSTQLYPIGSDVKLDVVETYHDLRLRYTNMNIVLVVTPKTTLYPSKITIVNPETKLVRASFNTNLQIKDSTFETHLGATTGVIVKENNVDEKGFKITLTSILDRAIKVRVAGFELKGRTKILNLEPRQTQTFVHRFE